MRQEIDLPRPHGSDGGLGPREARLAGVCLLKDLIELFQKKMRQASGLDCLIRAIFA